ncbi:MAG: hypothetical protein HC835_13465 [Oscillatoriales cyanobacterium RM2_1_1]|nr:hypothetical protein [Oscillatoriales cyanobacterium SM2_3_0]NJO46554.1 hypothetical protein [Oscillatoriales cyanobacterium RM2_1_1]
MTSSEGIEQRFREIDQELGQLRQSQDNLSGQLEQLTRVSLNLVESIRLTNQQADRDRVAFQAEIRQIWEYLLRDRPNGGSG